MTNHKELAERIVKQFFGINNLSEFDDEVKEILSILSEYQGEAYGYIAIDKLNGSVEDYDIAGDPEWQRFFLYANKEDVERIGWKAVPLYLSAPIKKEESSDE